MLMSLELEKNFVLMPLEKKASLLPSFTMTLSKGEMFDEVPDGDMKNFIAILESFSKASH